MPVKNYIQLLIIKTQYNGLNNLEVILLCEINPEIGDPGQVL